MNKMYFFVIPAKPKPEVEDSDTVGGAFVSCWINFKIQDGAELLATYYIEQAGWTPGEVDTVQWIEQQDYEDDPETLQYYMEADADGASFVFHQWPVGAEDVDEEP